MSTRKNTKSSKAVTQRNSRLPVAYDDLEKMLEMDANVGRYGLSNEDFAIAALVVVQRNATMPGASENEGMFYNFATRQYSESVDVIVAGIDHPRTFKDEESTRRERKSVYHCASGNGLSPLADFLGKDVDGEIIPPLCKDCPFNASQECRPRYRYYGFLIDPEGGPLREFSYKPIYSAYQDMKAWNIELADDEANKAYWSYRLTPVEGAEWWHTQVDRIEQISDKSLLEGLSQLRINHRRQQLDSVQRILNAVE